MTDVREILRQQPTGKRLLNLLAGYVSYERAAPASFDDPVWVIVPSHGPDNPYGPLGWPAIHGATVPAAGTPSLLAIDDQGTPWVVDWGGTYSAVVPGLWTVKAKSGDYTAASGEDVHVQAGGATITSPPTVLNNVFRVYNDTASDAATVTAAVAGGVISGRGIAPGGVTSISLNVNGAFAELICDGTDWRIVGGEQDTGYVTPTGWQNSWTASGSFPATYRLRGSTFAMYGAAVPGSNSTFLQLPTGLIIPSPTNFPCFIGGSDTIGYIEVDDTGALSASQFTEPVFLNPIRYEVD